MRFVPIITIFLFTSAVTVGQISLRSVDFKNFTYFAYCADDEPFKVTVSNGEFLHRGKESSFDYLRFWVHSVEYGDLDGDLKDEAIVITVCHPGGTGKFSEGYIFSTGKRKPLLIGRFPGGDRAAGGFVSAYVKDDYLFIERNQEEGGLCCPYSTITNTYRFSKGQLQEVGTAVRKELYPAARLKNIELGKPLVFQSRIDYLNRYVVSGEKGQVLSVTTDQQNAPIYQFRSGERIDDGMKGLKARFDKDGDIVFDVHNNEDNPRLFTITIKIDQPTETQTQTSENNNQETSLVSMASFNYAIFIICPIYLLFV